MSKINKKVQSPWKKMPFLIVIPSFDQLFFGHGMEIVIHFKKLIPIKEVMASMIQELFFSFSHRAASIGCLSISYNKVLFKIKWP
jgi:hypothetical protein